MNEVAAMSSREKGAFSSLLYPWLPLLSPPDLRKKQGSPETPPVYLLCACCAPETLMPTWFLYIPLQKNARKGLAVKGGLRYNCLTAGREPRRTRHRQNLSLREESGRKAERRVRPTPEGRVLERVDHRRHPRNPVRGSPNGRLVRKGRRESGPPGESRMTHSQRGESRGASVLLSVPLGVSHRKGVDGKREL